MVSDGSAVSAESGELAIVSAGISNKGIKREINEDAFSILEKAGYQVFLVADGLGGPKRGAVASNLALSSIRIALKEFSTFDDPSILRDAVIRANKDVFEKASASKTLHGMGTTLTGLVVANNKVFTVNVGNSRIYKVVGGKVSRLTVDHTVVEELRREGVEPSKDLDLRPKSHLLTRSLGVKPTLDVEVVSQPDELQPGDVFLLCTDGLHDLVDDDEIAGLVSAHPLKDAAHLLVNLANERGGHDNITVVLLQAGARDLGAEVVAKPKKVDEVARDKTPTERGMRRLAPLKARVREELPGAKAPSRITRQSVPGRELLDLRERDDVGEVVPVKPARAGRKRLKPPAPAAASSGGRGAQRLSASPALGKAPLSRRLPPLTQRLEERKGRESSLAAAAGLAKGEQSAGFKQAAQSAGTTGRSTDKTDKIAIELTPKSVQSGKSPTAAPTKPQLLSSAPASEVRVPAPVILGLGFGLLLMGGLFAARFISTVPVSGGPKKDSAFRSKPSDLGSGAGSMTRGREDDVGVVSQPEPGDGLPSESSSDDRRGSEDPLPDPISRTEEGRRSQRKDRRDDGGALQEVKEQSAARVRDTMLRSMLIDVIDAIEQAVRSAEGVIEQLEQGEVEMNERLQKMAEISREAVVTLSQNVQDEKGDKGAEPTKGGPTKKDRKQLPKSVTKTSPPSSLAEKKRRLIEGLPDDDPFAKD